MAKSDAEACAVITTALPSRSSDIATRSHRYIWTMGLRVACFAAMIFVPGVWRWVLLGGAAFLPAIAVILANAVDLRVGTVGPQPEVAPLELLAGPIISGDVVDS